MQTSSQTFHREEFGTKEKLYPAMLKVLKKKGWYSISDISVELLRSDRIHAVSLTTDQNTLIWLNN